MTEGSRGRAAMGEGPGARGNIPPPGPGQTAGTMGPDILEEVVAANRKTVGGERDGEAEYIRERRE